uniref:Uncharacterized protein n=1 Tax=Anguilla anguilla TaxID=7936 RepID=A0A0E9X8M6_ANGAN
MHKPRCTGWRSAAVRTRSPSASVSFWRSSFRASAKAGLRASNCVNQERISRTFRRAYIREKQLSSHDSHMLLLLLLS